MTDSAYRATLCSIRGLASSRRWGGPWPRHRVDRRWSAHRGSPFFWNFSVWAGALLSLVALGQTHGRPARQPACGGQGVLGSGPAGHPRRAVAGHRRRAAPTRKAWSPRHAFVFAVLYLYGPWPAISLLADRHADRRGPPPQGRSGSGSSTSGSTPLSLAAGGRRSWSWPAHHAVAGAPRTGLVAVVAGVDRARGGSPSS